MKINWNYIKGFVLVALVLFLFGFTNLKNGDKKIVSLEVEFEQGDNLFMDYEMVNKLLIQNDATVKNKAKSLIDLNSLEEQVTSHPMVEEATTYVTVDGRLKTKVRQRTPIGRINSGSASYYLDRQGIQMPLSKNYSARVPIVTGFSEADDTKMLFTLLKYIGEDDFLKKQIVGVHKENKNHFVLLTRVGNHEIDFGAVENLELKFKNLKAFYNYAMENEAIENYKRINLNYNNQVVCTKK